MRRTNGIIAACLLATFGCGASGSNGVATAAVAAPRTAEACAALAESASPGLVVSRAEIQPAGPIRLPFPPPGTEIQVPAHCIVRGEINPRTGEGGRHFGIGFELRMPLEWNGRFMFQGGGGLDGAVQAAIGMTSFGSPPALVQGFAVVTTDAGHQGMDASFATDPQARIDYAYNAIEVVTLQARKFVAQFYGDQPDYSYLVGCSNGGRQGMIAAQRFPDLFDGIVAGNPGFRLSRAALGEMWDNSQFARVAPRGLSGRPIYSQAFSDTELKLVADGALATCDALDGLRDGMINNRAACRFDPGVLQCQPGSSVGDCLTAEKVTALRAVFQGARDSGGRQISSSWPYDAGIVGRDWRMWKLGTSPIAEAPNGLNQLLGTDAFTRYFASPPYAQFDPQTYNFDEAAARVAETGRITDAVATDLSAFHAAGGRMIIYQGLSDPVFSSDAIAAWYDEAAGRQQIMETARLFMVPGMNHCTGGPATDQFDAFTRLRGWVERGEAPDRLVARGASFPGVTRPLCPHPTYAHYTGGDKASEASFQCRAPQ